MLSNSDPRQKNPENTFFDDLYAGFHIQRISIFRSICSIAEKREAYPEPIIDNGIPCVDMTYLYLEIR